MSVQNRDWQQREGSPLLRVVGVISALGLSLACLRADLDPAPETVADALERLSADSYAERERASHDLWRTGKTAEPYLELALGHRSIEVRARARRVLQLLRFGLHADARPEHWAFIRQFHSSEPQNQATVLFKMLEKGESSLALGLLEGSGESRRKLLAQLEGQLERLLPGLLIKGDVAGARRLIDILASGGHRLRYAAWFHYLTGTIDNAAARLVPLTAADATARRRLYYLSLARGDTDTAELLASALNLSDEERGFGLGDISPADFAKRSADATNDQVESLGFLAAHARLIGDDKKFRANIVGLERVAQISRKERPFCLEALIINGETTRAIKSSATAMEPFRIHARQWNVSDALQSLGITTQSPPFSPWIENLCRRIESTRRLKTRQELVTYPYALADLCMQTGERAEAERVCRLTANALLKADELSFHQAIQHETKLGLHALANEHALQALKIGTPEISVFLGLYGKSNQHARNWYDYLRKRGDDKQSKPDDKPDDKPDERLRVLKLILTPSEPGTEARAEVAPIVAEALTAINPLRGVRKSTWATTLAYAASLHGVKLPEEFTVAAEPAKTDAEPQNEPTLPMATRVLGRPQSVLSPHGTGWIIDVTGKAPGSIATCPFSDKKFIVPPRLESAAPLRPRTDDGIRTLIDTGNAHLAAERHDAAATAFAQAVEASGNEAAPQLLYQLGEALELSGNQAAADARKLQARLLAPLTSDRMRFIEYLWEQGHVDTVAVECRFLYLGNQSRIAAADARLFEVVARFLAKSDPLRSADLWEMKLLTALRKQHGITLTDALESRFLIHHTRAIGHQQLGDLSAALDELKLATTMLPADARIAEAIAPLLEYPAIEKDAEALLDSVASAAQKAAAQFPTSVMLRENHERVSAVMSGK